MSREMIEDEDEAQTAIHVLEAFRASVFAEVTLHDIGPDKAQRQTVIPSVHVNAIWSTCTDALLSVLKTRLNQVEPSVSRNKLN